MNLPSDWVIVRLKDIVLDTQPGFAQRPSETEGSTPQIRTHNVSPDSTLAIVSRQEDGRSPTIDALGQRAYLKLFIKSHCKKGYQSTHGETWAVVLTEVSLSKSSKKKITAKSARFAMGI